VGDGRLCAGHAADQLLRHERGADRLGELSERGGKEWGEEREFV
jgi:hypothetical protein